MPQTIFVQMVVQVMTWLQKEATTPPPSVNLYPKGGNPGKKVENPVAAIRKSLPKGRKTREKGRETRNRHPEISTQIAEKRRSFNKIKKRTGKSALIVKRHNPASYLGGKGLFKKQKICKKSTEHYTVQAYF